MLKKQFQSKSVESIKVTDCGGKKIQKAKKNILNI